MGLHFLEVNLAAWRGVKRSLGTGGLGGCGDKDQRRDAKT